MNVYKIIVQFFINHLSKKMDIGLKNKLKYFNLFFYFIFEVIV